MYKDRIKQYYFATVSEGEKYFQLKIQSILSNIKTHTLTWKSVSVKKKTMAREHSFQKQSKFQHQWAMWLTGCAVVLIVGIRPNKPIQWKKSFVFVTDDSFHRSITNAFQNRLIFQLEKVNVVWSMEKSHMLIHIPRRHFSFLTTYSNVQVNNHNIVLCTHEMSHPCEETVNSLSFKFFFPPFSTVFYFLQDIAQRRGCFFLCCKTGCIFVKMNHFPFKAFLYFQFIKEFAVAPQKDS